MRPFTGVVFDAYGTLLDVSAVVAACEALAPGEGAALSRLWRQRQLEYTWLRSLMGRYIDFMQITTDALDYTLDGIGVNDPALRRDLLDAYLTLEAYPDVRENLARLKQAGLRTAVLSNGSPAMLQAALRSADLVGQLDAALSADEVKLFKPHPSVYQLAVDRLGVAASETCFVTANAWDAAGAASFGMTVVWLNRFAQLPERLSAPPQAEIVTLEALPGLLGIP